MYNLHSEGMSGPGQIVVQTFIKECLEQGFGRTGSDAYSAVTADTFDAEIVMRGISYAYALYRFSEGVGYLYQGDGSCTMFGAAKTEADLDAVMDQMRDRCPKDVEIPDDQVRVQFWALGANGPIEHRRKILVPSWEDITSNYSSSVLDNLQDLMDPGFRPGKAGQLILWHGPPGTGKTTALRALGRQWRDWCELHFIVDPEKFFGSSSDYMLHVMLQNASMKDRWRLLVLEDSGELLAADARVQLANPQGLSRFINAVDGILGQGLKFMVLVTTNEEIGKLHEAVIRPGRCTSAIEFNKFGKTETEEWLRNRGVANPPNQGMTLAEMYALAEDFGSKKRSSAVGFGFA